MEHSNMTYGFTNNGSGKVGKNSFRIFNQMSEDPIPFFPQNFVVFSCDIEIR